MFYQNCGFCHEHSNQKRALIPQFPGPTLIGLYESKPELSDDVVRALIRMGISTRMTGFQYTLTSQEIDASWLPRNDPADQTAGRA